jgi:hypothetical protein
MSAPILRRGVWWQEQPNGPWLRWDPETQAWKEAADPPPPPRYRDAPNEQTQRTDLELFKAVVEHFRHNLTIYWQHSNFFIVIEAALLSVFTGFETASERESIVPALGIFGILVALFWWWVSYGRWKLINIWRDELKRLDWRIDRHRAFFRGEVKSTRRTHLIPAFAGLFLPPLIALGWIALIVLV